MGGRVAIKTPLPSSPISFKTMWGYLNKLFFGAFFFLSLTISKLESPNQDAMWKKSFLVFLFSLSIQKVALDCERMRKTNEFPSPSLYSQTDTVMWGQNVSLSCFQQNKSLEITYFLFRDEKCLQTQDGKGEPVTFNLTISEARDLGPYKCKVQVANCAKYSQPFNFTLVDPVTAPVLNISVIQTKTDRYIALRCISFNGSLPIDYIFFEKNINISPVISKNVRKPAEFNITESNTAEVKEYRCKANNRLPNHAKYSQPVTIASTGGDCGPFCLQFLLPGLLLVLIVIILILVFWMLPKYKARKAMKDSVPRVYGNTPMEAGIYANVCENQADEKPVPGLEPKQCVSSTQDAKYSVQSPEVTCRWAEYSQEIHYADPMFQQVAPRDQEDSNNSKGGYVYSELVF
ncbi:allergin-1 isoform X1 [Odocoileus virginianus]|uniref:Allergin-1 isoform X1 n=1 Tax=Odocoileus virginianus TaxID=9874 RepID=A0A6J0YX62_ODOVR